MLPRLRFFMHTRDQRITGLVLLNPWVRTDQGAAKTYLKHYYLTRLLDPNSGARYGTGVLITKRSSISREDR